MRGRLVAAEQALCDQQQEHAPRNDQPDCRQHPLGRCHSHWFNRPCSSRMLVRPSCTDASGAPSRTLTASPWTPCLRSEEHTSELQSPMRISYDVFCLTQTKHTHI